MHNSLNDPNYIIANARNWRTIWNDCETAFVRVESVTEQTLSSASNSGSINTGTAGTSEASKSMIGGDFDLGEL
jgi:hypothetical protein